MSKILNNDYSVQNDGYTMIVIDRDNKLKKDQINDLKKQIQSLKVKAKSYIEFKKKVDVFMMSEIIGVPPFLCRDLINNL